MSLIQVSNLTFAYDGSYDNIFENASFSLDTDWRLGFIGRNGRGKTTFLNLLMGKYQYQGSITADVQFDYFPFSIPDMEQFPFTLAEELLPELPYWELARELSLLEVEEDVLYRPFSTLSNGEQTKVLLALLFLRENHFLLIDEPTNHLDRQARAIVGDYLKRKRGFILVSHDRDFLNRAIDHVLSINRADITVERGNFDSWQENRERTDNFERAEHEKLKKSVKQLETAARRTAEWSKQTEKGKHAYNSGLRPDRGFVGHKAAKLMQRAKNTERRQLQAVEDQKSLLKNIEYTSDLKLAPLRHHAKVLAELQNVTVSYREKSVFQDFSLSIQNGERVALAGRNGCGKSTVLKLLLGQEIPHTGMVSLASGLTVSYVSQDTSHLQGALSEFSFQHGIDQSLFQSILRKMGFDRVQFEKRIEEFSGGQKKKVLLAKSLCDRAHLYLWDEPLNFVDVLSRIQLEELLLEHQPTMLFVEHDARFTETIATRIAEFQ